MRFWVVSAPGQQDADNFLRDSSVRFAWDPEGEQLRLEDRHLVFGDNDVRDAGGGEPIQDKQRRVVNKDSERADLHSFLCLCQ